VPRFAARIVGHGRFLFEIRRHCDGVSGQILQQHSGGSTSCLPRRSLPKDEPEYC
jgi:hypothetical protein